jgi:hypothetical protein
MVVNAVVLGFFARGRRAVGRAPEPATPLVVTQWVTAVTPPLPASGSPGGTNRFHWGELESEDYKEYIARLRAVGCPEQTIRDLVIADIDKLYAPRLLALRPLRKELHYWESEDAELANNQDARELARRERELEREKARILKDLLGIDLPAERQRLRGQADKFDRRLAFLPEARRSELRQVLESFEDRELTLRQKNFDSGATPSAEDREALRALRQSREESLARLLTPEERDQFELWMSPTSEMIRHDFYGMDATEAEFRSVYEIRKAFERSWPADSVDPQDAARMEQWGTALLGLEEQIKQALGEERYAMYQRGQDARFHDLNVTSTRFGLPREKAAEAYEYLRISESERSRVLGNASLTPEQQAEVVRRIDAETQRSLRELLGAGAYYYFSRLSN